MVEWRERKREKTSRESQVHPLQGRAEIDCSPANDCERMPTTGQGFFASSVHGLPRASALPMFEGAFCQDLGLDLGRSDLHKKIAQNYPTFAAASSSTSMSYPPSDMSESYWP